MKTIRVCLDDEVIVEVDRAAAQIGLSRSAFARAAIESALGRQLNAEMERRHCEGYRAIPVQAGEFDVWHDEQVWPEMPQRRVKR